MDFLDSSFFAGERGKKNLPTPAEVTARSKNFYIGPRLNCPSVVVEEAECLRMVKKALGNKVPVPEVYGWKVEGNNVFTYMEFIRGESLHNRWDTLSNPDKTSICNYLREIVVSLRQVEQDPTTTPFIGSITGGRLLDYVFADTPPGGPFKCVSEFNDWLSKLPQHWVPESRKYENPYRQYLPDSGPIKLTHGDLHQGNIMISSTSPPRVLAVVDWAHGGWYPDCWEYCMALCTAHWDGERRKVWIPKFLSPLETEFAIGEYVTQMGAIRHY